ncbi:MAG: hypothetical protein H6511_03760 [Holophagales bacterium]|nr:hypothetical protein [Holophagales bacterium]
MAAERTPEPFDGLDRGALSRALAAIADRPDDTAEIYLERKAEVELPPGETRTGERRRVEEGLAVRLVRGERAWSAARDRIGGTELADALRQVARTLPPALAEPRLDLAPWEPRPPAALLAAFAGEVERALRRRHVAFPLRITARWHRRDLQVVGPLWVPEPEREDFCSFEVELPWGRSGGLARRLDAACAERVARALAARFRAREATPPEAGRPPLLLAPEAAAVLLHEAVAHALEADLLALGGSPEGAIGRELGGPELDILDDPGRAPAGAERRSDDEGVPVARRWLLRGGRVEQPIADQRHARRSERLLPGSGFRSGRHTPPRPRTYHLELAPGAETLESLHARAEGGLWIGEIDAGRLDPRSGEVLLHAPCGRRIRDGAAAESVGPFAVATRVADLLGAIVGIGSEPESAGAGWCAKANERRPVWATVPALLVSGPEVRP